MSERPLTPAQAAILGVLQKSDPDFGRCSGQIAANDFRGRYAKWATPKLRALAKRGLVRRDARNLSRWMITPAGLAHVASAACAQATAALPGFVPSPAGADWHGARAPVTNLERLDGAAIGTATAEAGSRALPSITGADA